MLKMLSLFNSFAEYFNQFFDFHISEKLRLHIADDDLVIIQTEFLSNEYFALQHFRK